MGLNIALLKHSTGYVKVYTDDTDYCVVTTGKAIKYPELWFSVSMIDEKAALTSAIDRTIQYNELTSVERIK